jgi:hypothetical protein
VREAVGADGVAHFEATGAGGEVRLPDRRVSQVNDAATPGREAA